MNAFLDEQYYLWLQGRVCSVKNPSAKYEQLFHILYETEFVWTVPNDDNRVADGKYLRHAFLNEEGIKPAAADKLWMDLECSMLELFVHLSDLLEFLTDESNEGWFWQLLKNAGLDRFDEKHFDPNEVEDILERIIWRQYAASGQGGLFPLETPSEDQRRVELWYQLNAYVMERM